LARPQKDGLDYFPKFNPQINTVSRFGSSDFKTRYKALRNASSSFIKRKDVRQIILTMYDNKCTKCGSTKSLEIDHIISVYLCAKGYIDVENLNAFENLTILCGKCNSGRCPNEQT
jgi:5-methylcytosine-specific restriction endonuclease McrA